MFVPNQHKKSPNWGQKKWQHCKNKRSDFKILVEKIFNNLRVKAKMRIAIEE